MDQHEPTPSLVSEELKKAERDLKAGQASKSWWFREKCLHFDPLQDVNGLNGKFGPEMDSRLLSLFFSGPIQKSHEHVPGRQRLREERQEVDLVKSGKGGRTIYTSCLIRIHGNCFFNLHSP